MLVGSLNLIATWDRTNLNPVMDFLSAYNNHTIMDHLKAALYSFWYVHLTSDLGIHLYYASSQKPHIQIHHPFPHNKEVYFDASAPTPTSQNKLTGY